MKMASVGLWLETLFFHTKLEKGGILRLLSAKVRQFSGVEKKKGNEPKNCTKEEKKREDWANDQVGGDSLKSSRHVDVAPQLLAYLLARHHSSHRKKCQTSDQSNLRVMMRTLPQPCYSLQLLAVTITCYYSWVLNKRRYPIYHRLWKSLKNWKP